MNKAISKEIFIKNKILTPNYFIMDKDNLNIEKLKLQIKQKNRFPIILKPINEGSSLGVKISKDFKNLISSQNRFLKI